MLTYLNGEFVPSERAMVPVTDRGFLYGDGLFETLLISQGKPFRWARHWERLAQGAAFLQMRLPCTTATARAALDRMIAENGQAEALGRITVSRGVGPRGYSPRGADHPTFVITQHPAPPRPDPTAPVRWKLRTASFRLNHADRLAQYKTANKLAQVMARAEIEAAGADEALLLNDREEVVEAAAGNLFWIEQGSVCTPPIEGILPGVTRQAILEVCQAEHIATQERNPTLPELAASEGVFVSLSSYGVVPALSINDTACKESPLTLRVLKCYLELVRRETR